MRGSGSDRDRLIERVVRGEASADERAELAAWRRLTPENERHFRRTERLIVAASERRPRGGVPPRPSADALLAASAARTAAGRARGGARWLPWGVAAAASAAALVAVLGVGEWGDDGPWAPAEIVTGATELATVTLGDGTVVRLAPSSRLRMEPDRPREVSLEGRAFFSVTQMEDGRPFRVRTPDATANVLGTRFELVTDSGGSRLRVVEGRVELGTSVNSVHVVAGEGSEVRDGAATPATRLPDQALAPGWLGSFLVFQATPLRDAARDIERVYGVRVDLEDAALADITVTASFTDRPLDNVVNVVCAVLNARCSTHDGVVTIAR
jgi:ferric-dicitrate binding protein FerR (iron transport regulator)